MSSWPRMNADEMRIRPFFKKNGSAVRQNTVFSVFICGSFFYTNCR